MNVYDFDETIFDGDTALSFFIDFFKKDPSLIRFVPDALKIIHDYKSLQFRFEDAVDKFGYLVSEYAEKKHIDLHALAVEFWDKHEHQIKPFYKQVQKPDDLVISASPTFILEEICKRIGIKHYLGTEFDEETFTFGRGCFREKKIEFFRDAYPDGVIDDFYTDSMHDEFLFPYAKRVFMVKGHKIKQIK